MAEDEKDEKIPSKIDLGDILPLIEKMKKIIDLYEKNKILYDVIRKIPEEHITLKNVVKEIICDDEKLITKREFNDIWKKTHKKVKISIKTKKKLDESELIEDIKYDENIIRITNNGIYFIKPYEKDGIKYEEISLMLDGKLEILYKTKDKNKETLFTYKFDNEIYHTKSLKKILLLLSTNIYKGQFGKDIIMRYFNVKKKIIPKRKPEFILGFNNGWKLPQLEDEEEYTLILYTDIDDKIYEASKKIIRVYDEEEKNKIKELMSNFIKITQIKDVKLAIIIGWSLAAPFRLTFIKHLNVFPMLCLVGSRNTGKSYINEFFSVKFYKILDNSLTPYHLSSTSRTEDYLSSSTFPLNFQEVDYINREVIPILKEHCTGTSNFERKSSATEIFSKPKVAPICIDANKEIKSLSDHAMNTKIINLNFTEEEKIIRDIEWIKIKNELKHEKLFSFIYDITKKWKDENILKELTKIEEHFKDDIEHMDKFYPRLSQTFQIIMFGILLFETTFKIKLKRREIVEELIKSRQYLSSHLLDKFIYFCTRAKYHDEEKFSHVKYINHKLHQNKKLDYDFTQENLKDFNDYLKSFSYYPFNLKELGGLLNDALSSKDKYKLKYTITTRGDKSIGLIIIKNEFLPDKLYEKDEKEEDLSKDDIYIDAEPDELDF